jgi:hypothetical protein
MSDFPLGLDAGQRIGHLIGTVGADVVHVRGVADMFQQIGRCDE